jgi:trehalose 6-phosphate phosphatase
VSKPSSSAPPLAEDPLFFLDYDGTLAPIVDDPAEAHPHPEVPALLRALAERQPVWIVTGRDLESIETFFEAAGLLDLDLPAIGLHGTQEGVLGAAGDPQSLASTDALRALAGMRRSLPDLEGVKVEDKGDAFAVHYRAAPDEEAALDRLRVWAAEMPDTLDAVWGKKVVELRPQGLTKGTAVRRVADQHPGCTPVYLGDDTTDEDAFEELAGTDGAITARVGGGATAARYRLAGPAEVARYLRRYVENGVENGVENEKDEGRS